MGEPAKKLDFDRNAMLEALLAAPLSDEPETEEERAAFEEAERFLSSGQRGIRGAEMSALIDQMRRDAGE